MQKLIFILFLLSTIYSARGDLISYTYKGSKLASDIQIELENYVYELGASSIINPNSIENIKLYSIVYESIDQFGQYSEASGLISLPDNYNVFCPLFVFGHGTQVRRHSAPSMGGFNTLNSWISSSGYIYIEPDYLGLGVSEISHPYHLKDVTAASMIDIIYAAKELCDLLDVVNYNSQLFIAGYSEGGYATMAAVKEIEENYDDLNITLSFPMAGAYDLSGTMVDLMLSTEVYADPFYLPFFILSYIEKYNLGPISDFFLPKYVYLLPDLFSGEYSGGYINRFLPDIPINMMLPSMVSEFQNNEEFPFRVYLEENNLIDWIPESPMYIFHGLADERVPYKNSEVAYNKFIENGSTSVYYEALPEVYGGHQEAAPFCLIQSFFILEDAKQVLHKGDINQDSLINIIDIISVLNSILLDDTDSLDLLIDLNYDDSLNVFDLIILIEDILKYE